MRRLVDRIGRWKCLGIPEECSFAFQDPYSASINDVPASRDRLLGPVKGCGLSKFVQLVSGGLPL
jgi:hypothetical protein